MLRDSGYPARSRHARPTAPHLHAHVDHAALQARLQEHLPRRRATPLSRHAHGRRSGDRADRAGYEVLGDPRYPQRHAIEHIQPGQVLVMDCRGVASAANAGDILVSRLQVRGAAGLVLAGDIMVGDGEGVVCVPRAMADKVAEQGLEQEQLEAFILEKVRGGAGLPGTYPPDEQTLAEYEAWKRKRGTV